MGNRNGLKEQGTTVVVDDEENTKGRLKSIGGSLSDHWNNTVADQAAHSLWLKNSDDTARNRQVNATIAALTGIAPQNELEGMMAAQLLAAHNAAMECYRRAMIGEKTFEGRRENLNQANKLSRTWATLLDALNKHRGKGQQKVTVSTYTSMQGDRRSSGRWSGRGGQRKDGKNNPMRSELAMHRTPRCGARTRAGLSCRAPAMNNGRCRMHGGASPGAPLGNRNAWRHGRYSAEAISHRRELRALIAAMRASAEQV